MKTSSHLSRWLALAASHWPVTRKEAKAEPWMVLVGEGEGEPKTPSGRLKFATNLCLNGSRAPK